MPSTTNAPAPPPALVASAEGEPVTDLDHARYDRDGWMESALRAQGYVGELQGRLAAAESARDEAIAERDEALRISASALELVRKHALEAFAAESARDAALARAERLEEALRDCVIQIEYEHGKFGGTGSGETVLHRTRALLAEEAKP